MIRCDKLCVSSETPSRVELFDAALEEHRHQFARIARVYADHEAEDLLQEMLLQIWRGLSRFRGDCAIGTWCYRVALNTALSWRRKSGKRREVSDENLDQRTSSGSPTDQPQRSLLRDFLATLTDVDQAILLMHLANQDGHQTAEALDMSEGAVRTRLSRLRTKLSDWGDQHA